MADSLIDVANNQGSDGSADAGKSPAQEVLDKHNLTLEDFNITEIPFLRIKGSFRKAITKIEDLEIETLDDDEFQGAKKIILEFTLPSGVYATTFLENFFTFT